MPARAKSIEASEASAMSDPVVYPETDHMGEHELQRFIAELLRPLIERYLREQGRVAHAGADTFFYFVKGDPTQRLAPDVYVLDGVSQELVVSSWKLWEGVPAPSFALEIVTSDALKDYQDVPHTFGRIGGRELVLCDPEAKSTSKRRARLTVFRRGPEGFRLVEQTHGDRVFSESLGCHLRVVGEGPSMRVRLGLGPNGDELFPTEAEARARENEAVRAENEAVRAENERLRRELAALRAEKP